LSIIKDFIIYFSFKVRVVIYYCP